MSDQVSTSTDETKISMVCDALNRDDWPNQFLFSKETKKFVLIIDEINRGNVSKILGELITLIEESKRLTAVDGLVLPLTYSQDQRFGVPPNLHILGTMNTSDRSIALIDIALRRRFEFEEQAPDAEVLDKFLNAAGCDNLLRSLTLQLFDTINRRITFLYDADHQLGHAMFLNIKTLADLCQIFARRVVPLLLEYFYGAWDKVCAVLGCAYDDEGKPSRKDEAYLPGEAEEKNETPETYSRPFITVKLVTSRELGLPSEEIESKLIYSFNPTHLLQLPYDDSCRLLLGVLTHASKSDYIKLFSDLTGVAAKAQTITSSPAP